MQKQFRYSSINLFVVILMGSQSKMEIARKQRTSSRFLAQFGAFAWVLALTLCMMSLPTSLHAQPSLEKLLPEFRQVSGQDILPSLRKIRSIRFAVDEQFPPFAYRDAKGALTGFFPQLIDAICVDLKISCSFVTRDSDQMQGSLTGNQADAAVYLSDHDVLDLVKLDFTRPFLRPFARFATRTASPITGVDIRTLAGKRIGVREGTSHAAYIEKYYGRSLMVPFGSYGELYEALRTASVDVVFDDAFRLMFWFHGTNSSQCCHFIGKGFVDGKSFSQAFSFAVRREDAHIRKVLDHGLDRLQTSGALNHLYSRFFPQSPYE